MKRFLLILLFLVAACSSLFAVTIRLENDTSLSGLSSTEKEYYSLARNDFKNNLLLCNEINIRSDDVDARIRDLQRKTQVEAAQGMGSESSALEIDRVSRIDLTLVFRMQKSGSDYSFSYELTETESANSIGGESSQVFTLDTMDAELDALSLKVLKKLRDRRYITQVPPQVELQLKGLEYNRENLAQVISDLQREVAALQQEANQSARRAYSEGSAFESAYAADSLRLAKQAELERKQIQLEMYCDQQARAKAEEELLLKRQAETSRMQEAELARFQAEIAKIEKQRAAILKDAPKAFTLKKRIALIEGVRADRNRLLEEIERMNSFIEEQYMAEANANIETIENRPWRTAETDEYGNPTSKALKYRGKEINEIRSKAHDRIKKEQDKISQSQAPLIREYEDRLRKMTDDLCAKPYTFRSLDDRENYLDTYAGKFDGEKQCWTVRSVFEIKDIPSVDNRVRNLPPMEIQDSFVIGKRPQESNYAEYQKYLDEIENADLLFRTSTPYIYSELTVDIAYNSYTGLYELTFNDFRIYKTENRQKIYQLDKNKIEKDRTKVETRSSKSGTTDRNVTVENKGVFNSIAEAYEKSQRGREGTFFDVGFQYSDVYDLGGLNLHAEFNSAGRHWYVGLFSDGSLNTFSYYNYDTYSLFDLGLHLGYARNFFIFRAYGSAGGGFSIWDQDDVFFIWKSRAGLDLVLGNYSIGPYITYSSFPGVEIGISFGYRN